MADLIDRQAAIDTLMEILDRPNHAEFLYTDEICKALNALPSAQPERKTGRWILNDDGRFMCSRCGVLEHDNDCILPDNGDDPFCWHCGAKMEVEHEQV